MKNKAKIATAPTKEMLVERATTYMEEEQKLLKRHGLARQLVVNFPKSQNVPLMGRLAVKLLKWSGGVIDSRFGIVVKN